MVKLGVYLLARLKPAFGDLVMWEFTLVTIGALTAAWAMVLTLRERDLKRILAWSTVAALGTLVLLIGLPGPGAAEATAAFLLAHALYKAPLFFVAGNIDHQTGTRRIDDLSGLARTMPWTALAAALAACSMAGVPLSFGYVAKDLITTAKTEGLSFEWVSYATLAFSALSVAVASVAAVRIFWPLRGSSQPANVHEASVPMVAAPILVAASGIALGIMPSLSQSLLGASAQAMLPAAARPFVELVRPDAPLTGITVLVFALGAVIFMLWEPLHRLLAAATWLDRFGFASWYDRVLKSVPVLARAVTTRLQHGFLPAYLALALTCLAVVVAVAAWAQPSLVVPAWTRPSLAVAAASVLIGVAAIAACAALDAFVMVLVAGLAGVGSAVLALFLGAPDVAFTQFTVEVAFVVVVAAVIRRVQRFSLPSAGVHRRGARALLAVMCGGAVTLLLLMAAAGPLDDSATRYYGDRSAPEAFGRNVVNVVLVDFRALDTLGEVVVILLTLVAVLPIVHGLRARAPIDRRQP
jgi:multicomponent Na+:H+ antiporter subunit A